jgi:hypothetical protein
MLPFIAMVLLASPQSFPLNLLPNSSFEFPPKTEVPPFNWRFNLPSNGEAVIDAGVFHSGKFSLRISIPKDAPLGWYSAYQEFPIRAFNQHLTFSVFVKTRGVEGGAGAYCSINFFSGDRRISFHDSERKIKGDSDWERIKTTALVPQGANRMSVILVVHGYGTAWFDDAQLEIGDEATGYSPSIYDEELSEKLRRSEEKGSEFMEKVKPKRGIGKDVAIFSEDDFPKTGGTPSIDDIYSALKEAGFFTYALGAEELSNPSILSPKNFDLLILPYGPYFPAKAAQAVRRFLSEGGSMITIGGYAFDKPLFYVDGNWYEKGELPIPAGEKYPLFSLSQDEKWALGFPAGKASYKLGKDEKGENFLEVDVEELRGWATISSPPVNPSAFPSNFIIANFKAKGEGVKRLFFEWQEKDGSRWRSAVEVSSEWREYYISLADLQYWQDNPSVGRGVPGDHFRPQNADHISFSISVETEEEGKAYKFFLKDINILADTRGEEILFQEVINTHFGRLQDAMWPNPEQIGVFDPSHPLENADVAKPAPLQMLIPSGLTLKGPFTGFAAVGPIGRGAGHGFGPNVARILPLLNAFDPWGRFRGYLASIIHNYDGYYKGSSWAIFGVDNRNLFTKEALLPRLPRLAESLIKKTYLYGAGTEWACYRPGEVARLRVWVANMGASDRKCKVRFILGFEEGKGEWFKEVEVGVKGGEIEEVSQGYPIPKEEKRDFCYLRCELWEDGSKIDEMEEAFVIWQEKLMKGERPPIKDSYFHFGGRPKFIVGAQEWWGQIDSVSACSPLAWERDFQLMEDWGFRISRIFWPFSQRETERAKRANDALVYLAQKHNIILFGAPNLWDSLDRKALEEEVKAAREIAERYKRVKLIIIDLCNEPSLRREDSPQHREEFQRYLKEKYGGFERLKEVWEDKLVEKSLEEIAVNSLSSDVNDVRARDTAEFYLRWEKNWYDRLYEAMKKSDPSLLITVGCLQGFGWGDVIHDPILLSEDMDFTNRHYYGDLTVFPLELKEIDMQWLGKPLSVGECGARNHPGFEGYGHESTPEYNRRFLFLTHIAFGEGASFLNSWHWRDPMEGIFPFGLVHADRSPRQAGYIMRAMAYLFGSLHPKYQKPKVYLLTPQTGFSSGERMRFHDAFRRAIKALLQLKVDFEIATEDKLPLLKDAELILYPSPYAISDNVFSALMDFVRKGGKLYISGEIDRDENFQKRRAERLNAIMGKEENGIMRGKLGKGEIFYVREPEEMKGEVYELYEDVLRMAGIKGLAIEPENPDLLAFAIPTLEGGRTLTLVNYGKRGSYKWEGMEIELAERSTGFIHLSSKGDLLAVEGQGKVKIKEREIVNGGGHFILLSLDGRGIEASSSLLLIPLEDGKIEILRKDKKKLIAESGEMEKGNWRRISSPKVSQKGNRTAVEISQAERFSLVLLSDDLGKARNYLKTFRN